MARVQSFRGWRGARIAAGACLLALAWTPLSASDRYRIDWNGPVVVEAEEAWADSVQRSTRMSGGIVFDHPQWRMRADRALVSGPLDAPDSVRIEGEPATIILRESGQRPQLEGSGKVIDYVRERDTLTLSGKVSLIEGRRRFSAEHLEYDLTTRRLSSRGPVRMRYQPPGR